MLPEGGEQRLWRVICTVLSDWRQPHSLVRGFVDDLWCSPASFCHFSLA